MRVAACFTALALMVSSAAADPQDYGRVVSFGDSLSDNGNLKHFPTSTTPGSGGTDLARPAPYFDGRLSNGPTWVELLAGSPVGTQPSSQQRFWSSFADGKPLDGSSVNLAIGGARSDDKPNSNGPIPGVDAQIAAYQQYSAAFGQTAFKPTDLVTLIAGPNDIFQGGSPLTAANSVSAPNDPKSNLNQLVTAGAKTILIANLPDLGATPASIAQGKQAQALGTAGTLLFDQTLNTNIRSLAAAHGDVNFVQVDFFTMSQVIAANPAAFGFDPALTGKNCVSFTTHQAVNGCDPTTAKGFSFWDDVHPTEPVHQLLARYASLLLSTEQTGKAVGTLGQVGLSTRLKSSDILFRRGVSPFGPQPTGLYAEIIGSTGSGDGTNTRQLGSTAYDYSLGGVRAGFDADHGNVAFGSSVAYQSGSISGKLLNSNLQTTQGDVYALARFNPFFVGVEAGASVTDFDRISRDTGFPTVKATGQTSSFDYTLAATIGSQYHLGNIILTPAARVGYASLNLNGFTETAPLLALQYGDRDVSTGFYTVRLRAATKLPGLNRATVYGEVGYEDLFSTSGNSYAAQLVNNTAHGVTISDDLNGRGVFLKAGISGWLTEGVKVAGEYGYSQQNGTGEVHSGRLRLTIPLGGGE